LISTRPNTRKVVNPVFCLPFLQPGEIDFVINQEKRAVRVLSRKDSGEPINKEVDLDVPNHPQFNKFSQSRSGDLSKLALGPSILLTRCPVARPDLLPNEPVLSEGDLERMIIGTTRV
jgi:hypothetical protein